MKSYYEAHESAYKEIKAKGHVGWGNKKTLSDLGDARTEEYLRVTTPKWFDNFENLKALDLGCGTGTTAFTLAKLGFNVSGVDISPTAIEMAKDLAVQQDLNIQFEVGDILNLEKMNEKFDLIYDSHCFHCIVFDEDRLRVLTGIKHSLNDNGKFILDTMVMSPEFNPTDGYETLRFDKDFILWHKTKPSTDRGVVELDGQFWCAQRRILPKNMILKELGQAGFKVLPEYVDQQDESQPWMLRLVLTPVS